MNLFSRVIRWGTYLFMFMLGFAILKTAVPQRKSLQRRWRGTGWCKVLIEELMISEGFNERLCFFQPSQCRYMQTTLQVLYLP